jgi:type II secretory pathway pseudopilin PulG
MKIKYSRAFTLTEIIAASVVVGIMTLGIISASVSLQKNRIYYANSYSATQAANNILYYMLQDASVAGGTRNHPAVVRYYGIDMDDPVICFNHGTNLNIVTGLFTSYKSICYGRGERDSYIRTDGGKSHIRPSRGYAPIAILGNFLQVKVVTTTTGGVTSRDVLPTSSLGDIQISNTDIQTGMIEITVETCLDPSNPANNLCVEPDVGGVPDLDANGNHKSRNNPNNPYVIKTGSISIPGQSI